MNRRNFLKTLGAVVGTAIAAPAVLLAVKPKSIIGPYVDLDAPVQWRNYCGVFKSNPIQHHILYNPRHKGFVIRRDDDETIQTTE